MRTVQMVGLTNALFLLIVILISLLWPMIGSVVGYANSWWVAPLASFGGFLIAGRLIRPFDPLQASKAQFAILSLFCFGTLLWSVLVRNLGIPAWRVVLTLALCIGATWLARLGLGRMNA